MMENATRTESRISPIFFWLRPAEELYDLKKDPEQWLTWQIGSIRVDAGSSDQLFDQLKKTKDPRVVGGNVDWNHPYYGRIRTEGWMVEVS